MPIICLMVRENHKMVREMSGKSQGILWGLMAGHPVEIWQYTDLAQSVSISCLMIMPDDDAGWSCLIFHWWLMSLCCQEPGPWFNIKMSSYQYRKSHCGDKTVVRSSYLHNGISFTAEMSSLYWIGLWASEGIILIEFFQIIQGTVWGGWNRRNVYLHVAIFLCQILNGWIVTDLG